MLVGHSQAGNFAFALAEAHPKRVTHLVILGTGSLLPPLPDGAAKGKANGKKTPAEGREGTPGEPTIADTRRLLEATLFHHALITDDERLVYPIVDDIPVLLEDRGILIAELNAS